MVHDNASNEALSGVNEQSYLSFSRPYKVIRISEELLFPPEGNTQQAESCSRDSSETHLILPSSDATASCCGFLYSSILQNLKSACSRGFSWNRINPPLTKVLYGKKTIGQYGSFVYLVNQTFGAGVLALPFAVKTSGWLPCLVANLLVGIVAMFATLMVLRSMTMVAGNQNFERRLEYITTIEYYLGKKARSWVEICFYLSLQSLNIVSIAAVANSFDHLLLKTFGSSPALVFSPLRLSAEFYVFRSEKGIDMLYEGKFQDNNFIASISLGYMLNALICIPLSLQTMDENMTIQYGSFFLLLLSVFQISFSAVIRILKDKINPSAEPLLATGFPKAFGCYQYSQLLSTFIANFSYVNVIPSWGNEMTTKVKVNQAVYLGSAFSVIVYYVFGFILATAYPNVHTDNILQEMLVSKAVGSSTRAFIYIFNLFTLLPGILVYSITTRYNLLNSNKTSPKWSFIYGCVCPFTIAWVLTNERYFSAVLQWSSLLFSLTVNFIFPSVMYILACKTQRLASRNPTRHFMALHSFAVRTRHEINLMLETTSSRLRAASPEPKFVESPNGAQNEVTTSPGSEYCLETRMNQVPQSTKEKEKTEMFTNCTTVEPFCKNKLQMSNEYPEVWSRKKQFESLQQKHSHLYDSESNKSNSFIEALGVTCTQDMTPQQPKNQSLSRFDHLESEPFLVSPTGIKSVENYTSRYPSMHTERAAKSTYSPESYFLPENTEFNRKDLTALMNKKKIYPLFSRTNTLNWTSSLFRSDINVNANLQDTYSFRSYSSLSSSRQWRRINEDIEQPNYFKGNTIDRFCPVVLLLLENERLVDQFSDKRNVEKTTTRLLHSVSPTTIGVFSSPHSCRTSSTRVPTINGSSGALLSSSGYSGGNEMLQRPTVRSFQEVLRKYATKDIQLYPTDAQSYSKKKWTSTTLLVPLLDPMNSNENEDTTKTLLASQKTTPSITLTPILSETILDTQTSFNEITSPLMRLSSYESFPPHIERLATAPPDSEINRRDYSPSIDVTPLVSRLRRNTLSSSSKINTPLKKNIFDEESLNPKLLSLNSSSVLSCRFSALNCENRIFSDESSSLNTKLLSPSFPQLLFQNEKLKHCMYCNEIHNKSNRLGSMWSKSAKCVTSSNYFKIKANEKCFHSSSPFSTSSRFSKRYQSNSRCFSIQKQDSSSFSITQHSSFPSRFLSLPPTTIQDLPIEPPVELLTNAEQGAEDAYECDEESATGGLKPIRIHVFPKGLLRTHHLLTTKILVALLTTFCVLSVGSELILNELRVLRILSPLPAECIVNLN